MAINYATLVIKEAAGIHTITMNRPERRNALNPQMIAELTHAFADSATCPCGVVVLTGAGTAFCSVWTWKILSRSIISARRTNGRTRRRPCG